MKILILANDTNYVYLLRKEIITELINNHHSVIVLAEESLHSKELEYLGCRINSIKIDRHSKNPINELKLINQYKREIQKIDPELVLTYNIKPTSYGGIACQKLGITYISNITGLGTPLLGEGLTAKIAKAFYKAGLKKADCVFFQNKNNLNFFTVNNLISKESKARLLPGSGVNTEQFSYQEDKNFAENRFLFAARIMKAKGIDLFLNVAEIIKKERNDCHFEVCGFCDDPAYLEKLKKAEQSGTIKYYGMQKDLIPFYKEATCLLYPTQYPEGMSNFLLEGASSGIPIITFNRPGCKEIVENGVTGFISKQETIRVLITFFFLLLIIFTVEPLVTYWSNNGIIWFQMVSKKIADYRINYNWDLTISRLRYTLIIYLIMVSLVLLAKRHAKSTTSQRLETPNDENNFSSARGLFYT